MIQSFKFFFLIFSLLLIGEGLYSEPPTPRFSPVIPREGENTSHWLTGSLLAPGVTITSPGHLSLYPSTYFTTYTGFYTENGKVQPFDNFYSLQVVAYSYVGINSWLDFGIAPQMLYQFTQGERSTQFGDLPFGFNIQLLKKPALMLSFGASAPLGKYNKLNPAKKQTDAVGSGSWLPFAILSIGEPWNISPNHIFFPQFAIGYVIPTATHVKDFNAYGGGSGTNGTVYPGNIFWSNLSFQYNFTKHLVFAFDCYFNQENKTRFSGKAGELAPGIPATNEFPDSYFLSFAPALEYNFSSNLGIIGGVWFTALGRNDYQFLGGQLSISINI